MAHSNRLNELKLLITQRLFILLRKGEGVDKIEQMEQDLREYERLHGKKPCKITVSSEWLVAAASLFNLVVAAQLIKDKATCGGVPIEEVESQTEEYVFQ